MEYFENQAMVDEYTGPASRGSGERWRASTRAEEVVSARPVVPAAARITMTKLKK